MMEYSDLADMEGLPVSFALVSLHDHKPSTSTPDLKLYKVGLSYQSNLLSSMNKKVYFNDDTIQNKTN
jgi:hypothetical protein